MSRPNQFISKSIYFLLFLCFCFCFNFNQLLILVDSFQINKIVTLNRESPWRKTSTTSKTRRMNIKGCNFHFQCQTKGSIQSNSNLVVLAAAAAASSTANNNNNNNEEVLISLPETTERKPKKKKNTKTTKKSSKQKQSIVTGKKRSTKTGTKQTKTSSTPKTITTTEQRTWEESFQRLKEYKQEYGDCLVPQIYENDKKLGTWVNNQRKLKKLGKLKPERKDQLNEIGFSWEALADNWNNMYEELIEFREEHGHCNVEYGKYKARNRLAIWVYTQRKSGALLTKEQRSKLDNLGFVWEDVAKARADRQWEERFELLQDYKRLHGDTLVPYRWASENGVKLGKWVSRQRTYYHKKILRKDREEKLKKIGFVWRLREGNPTDWELMDEIWMDSFEQVKEFKTIHNHTNIPYEYDENPELGRWVYTQRQNHRLGLLKKDRQELLEGLGFEWRYQEKMFKKLWMEQYQNLVAFQKEYGHVDVPKSIHKDLYEWLKWQRMYFANDKLESDRKELLDKIRVDLNVRPGSLGFEEE